MLWLIATLMAAVFQPWRTAVQQKVRTSLSLNAAGLVRYFYGLPVAVLLLTLWCAARTEALPAVALSGWGWAVLAGFAQILGTNLLLMAFGHRNFVVGTAYAKTEAIQGALISMALLGERLSALSWAGVAVGVVGVLILAKGEGRFCAADIAQPAALCGLGAGLAFTFTSIGVKLATHGVGGTDTILKALVVLCVVQAAQVLMQGGFLLAREPEQWRLVLSTWRVSGWVGALSSLGSACWFTGFALAPVALVRTVGQAEVIFTVGFGRFYLKERVARREIVALVCVGVGVALALAGSLRR